MRILRRTSLFCILLVSLTMGANLPAQQLTANALDDRTWLVRLDLPDQSTLIQFAQSRVNVYTQLYSDSGSIILLLPAASGTLSDFEQKGFTFNILDQVPEQSNLYLLYGLPETIQQAGELANLLFIDGRQAVARANSEQVAALEALGIQHMPLALYPLPIPRSISSQAPNLPSSIEPDPTIQEMIDQVSSTALENLIKDLSGERAATIEGAPYTIDTRYTLTTSPINKATRYAFEYLQALGFFPDFEYYTFSYGGTSYERRNVIADQAGTTQPERVFMLIAHLDSTSDNPWYDAPGADDNASGSAALLHIASILSQYDFSCTLRYALFTGEEQGLLGSLDYANLMNEENANIPAVLNLDMLGYNTDGTARTIELHTRDSDYYPEDMQIASRFSNVIEAYSINLVPIILEDAKGFSDHKRFWDNGYPAILAIEDWTDHTQTYHKTGDTISTLNMSYYTAFAKAALGTFAHLGCLQEVPCQAVSEPTFTYAPANPEIDTIVTFTATVSSGAAPITYTWDFGDGTTGNGEVATHAYLTPGTFAVQLSADNACNILQTTTQSVFIGVDSFWLPVIFSLQQTQ